MEFELVSPDNYLSCQEIANRILVQTSKATHQCINKLKANDALTYLNNRYSPKLFSIMLSQKMITMTGKLKTIEQTI